MNEIIAALEREKVLDFLDYFGRQETLEGAIVSFFSLLELIRARLVIAVQEQLFQTIKVWLRKESSIRQ
jgi:segregation and condensation protein A